MIKKTIVSILLAVTIIVSALTYTYYKSERENRNLMDKTSSFPAGTKIITKAGIQNIESISGLETVWSYNLLSEKKEIASVTVIYTRLDTNFVHINDELYVTPLHPFATKNIVGEMVWKNAKDLTAGDCLLDWLGNCAEVFSVSLIQTEPQTVYNLHVSGNENYFVILNGVPVLVHNKLPPIPI